jgi:hypothetical protein
MMDDDDLTELSPEEWNDGSLWKTYLSVDGSPSTVNVKSLASDAYDELDFVSIDQIGIALEPSPIARACAYSDEVDFICDDGESEPPSSNAMKKKPGRVPFEKKYPAILPLITRILFRNGAQAQERRRTDVITSFGTHLPSLISCLYAEIPGLRKDYPKLHKSSIAYLMLPPRKNANNASNDKCLIQARPFRIENDRHNITELSHRCFATVNMIEEFFMAFPSEGVLIDADNMSKIKMNGTTAVSRYHQPRSYWMEGDVPKLDAHDFPIVGYSSTISGYVRLEHKDLNVKKNMELVSKIFQSKAIISDDMLEECVGAKSFSGIYRDKQDRLHLEVPRSGSLFLFLRTSFIPLRFRLM